MSNSLKLLNAVREYIVNFATENNIVLANEFKSRGDFQKFVVAISIKTLVDAGFDLAEAFNLVMGEGAYQDLAAKVWEANQPS